MAQQRQRPLTEPPWPFPGPDMPRQPEPLARVPEARPSPEQPALHASRAGRAQGQGRQETVTQQHGAPGDELQLDPATIVLSLPVALTIGQMIAERSLDAMPQAIFWAGTIVAWKAITAPGVGRGSLDWLVDAINLDPTLRRRLGVPERPLHVVPPPRRRGAWGFIDGLAADARTLRAAIRRRRGEVAAEDMGEGHPPATGRTIHLGAAPDPGLDTAAVEALDHRNEGEEPDIGLPVVTVEQIANLDNLWVVGPKGSGKTTLLRQLIALRHGKHWALDSHATPGKWPGCTVVGGGLEFADIDRQLHQFLAWMRQRYKAQATGDVTEEQCKAARRTMVGDEWRAIRKAIPEVRATRDASAIPSAADRLLDILSQGRKAGICALIASHADTAESMGVTGEKDILRCFDLIIYLGALATQRVPAAARMARPAVVYDPERDSWAQLVLAQTSPPPSHAASQRTASPEPTLALAVTAPAAGQGWQTTAAATPRPTTPTPPPGTARTQALHHTDEVITRASPTTGRAAKDTQGDSLAAWVRPAPGTAPDTSGDLLGALLAQPVSAAAGRQGTPGPVPRPTRRTPDTDTGYTPVSAATVTVGAGGHGGVTVNVSATAATTARPTRPRGRGGLDMRRRRRRAQEARQAERKRALAERYAEKKLAGWSFRRAYAELGGNSDEARAAWRAAPGPEAPQPRETHHRTHH